MSVNHKNASLVGYAYGYKGVGGSFRTIQSEIDFALRMGLISPELHKDISKTIDNALNYEKEFENET